MGFDDALNKAKGFAGDHPDQTDQALNAASDKGKDLAPDQVDGAIDKGSDTARDQLGLGGDDEKDEKDKK